MFFLVKYRELCGLAGFEDPKYQASGGKYYLILQFRDYANWHVTIDLDPARNDELVSRPGQAKERDVEIGLSEFHVTRENTTGGGIVGASADAGKWARGGTIQTRTTEKLHMSAWYTGGGVWKRGRAGGQVFRGGEKPRSLAISGGDTSACVEKIQRFLAALGAATDTRFELANQSGDVEAVASY
jgi:hypothetical protein